MLIHPRRCQRSALPAELWPRCVVRSQKCPFATVLQLDSSMRGIFIQEKYKYFLLNFSSETLGEFVELSTCCPSLKVNPQLKLGINNNRVKRVFMRVETKIV